MKVVGHCRLCLNEAELLDSHFIPKAAYRLIRGDGKNPHPYVNDGRKAIQTASQWRANLLCDQCEQRFSKNGEDAFFRYCYHGTGKFKLLDVLREQNPMVENDRWAAYVVPEAENSLVRQIGYMGLSVFWRSAVHTWRDRGGGTIPSISLGSLYQEQLRQYLLDSAPFPAGCAMILEVSDENNRLISLIATPISRKFSTHYLHMIGLCGVQFNLVVGSRMPLSLRNLDLFREGPEMRADRQTARRHVRQDVS
jgi:hypothetical protein